MLHIVAYARCLARSVLSQRFVELRRFAAKFRPTVEKDRERMPPELVFSRRCPDTPKLASSAQASLRLSGLPDLRSHSDSSPLGSSHA